MPIKIVGLFLNGVVSIIMTDAEDFHDEMGSEKSGLISENLKVISCVELVQ